LEGEQLQQATAVRKRQTKRATLFGVFWDYSTTLTCLYNERFNMTIIQGSGQKDENPKQRNVYGTCQASA